MKGDTPARPGFYRTGFSLNKIFSTKKPPLNKVVFPLKALPGAFGNVNETGIESTPRVRTDTF
jgi:hypothetical protein